jgi:hypothetical protein
MSLERVQALIARLEVHVERFCRLASSLIDAWVALLIER